MSDAATDDDSAAPASSAAAEILSKLKVSAGDGGTDKSSSNTAHDDISIPGIKFVNYQDEAQLDAVMRLVSSDLSEPYSIFTYRYFLMRFPELCILAVPEGGGEPVGCVVCKIDTSEGDGVTDVPQQLGVGEEDGMDSQEPALSGYMGMLAVETDRRGSGIGTALATLAIRRMRDMGCSSVTLETEVTNDAAIRLYEDRLGFVREEHLVRYYLNWGDAYRLRLWFD